MFRRRRSRIRQHLAIAKIFHWTLYVYTHKLILKNSCIFEKIGIRPFPLTREFNQSIWSNSMELKQEKSWVKIKTTTPTLGWKSAKSKRSRQNSRQVKSLMHIIKHLSNCAHKSPRFLGFGIVYGMVSSEAVHIGPSGISHRTEPPPVIKVKYI